MQEVPDRASRDAEGRSRCSRDCSYWEQAARQLIFLIERAAAQQMSIAVLSHPFGAGQMTFERMLRTVMISAGIYVQHDPRHFAPISAGCIGVKKSQICNDVLFVVSRQRFVIRRTIGNIGIKRGLLH
jgi:hypothetical protein